MLRNRVIIILLILFMPLFIYSEGLSVKYKCTEPGISSNQVRFNINIVNNGNIIENLADIKVRYYFILEGAANQNFCVDYAVIGPDNISGQFVQFGEQDYYLEVSFLESAGVLEPGDETGEIQIRFHKTDWTNYDQSNDYSFTQEISSFTDYEKITIYNNDELIWGKAPGDITLNITSAEFYTELVQLGDIQIGQTMLAIEGNTDADKVNVRVWGDGVIDYVELPIDADGNFSRTVQVCFTHAPDNSVFTISTTVTASKGTMTASQEVISGQLQYVKDLELNITNSYFYTRLSNSDGMEFGHTMLDIEGNTNGDAVKVKVWGDGLISYVDLPVNTDGNFSETVEICFTHAPDDTPFTVSTVVTASKGSDEISREISSTVLIYKETENWIPYYDNTASIEVSENMYGEYEAKVTLHFTSAGFRILDWGTSANPDAEVEMWTGMHAMVLTDIPHIYNLGILEPGEHTFIFKTWGNLTAVKDFFVEGGGIPFVNIISPGNNASFYSGDDILIKADAADPLNGIDKVEFLATLYDGDMAAGIYLGEDNTAPYEFLWENVEAGNYDITVKLTNNNGDETADTVNINVLPDILSDIKLQYKCMDTSDQTNSIRAYLNILNEGNETVPMSELEVRYYYTLENPAGQQFSCDYAEIGASNVIGEFINTGNDNYYLSLTFTNNGIYAGEESGEIQIRWNKDNWSQMDQTNDYSFNSGITALSEWDKIAIFRNGRLVWGEIPEN